MPIEGDAVTVQVHVKVFATLARWLPSVPAGQAVDVLLPTRSTISELVDRLGLPRSEVKVVFVNGRSRPLDWQLEQGDDIGVFPPIGGG